MSRVKGWAVSEHISPNSEWTDDIYVEEIPADAIRGEGTIEDDGIDDDPRGELHVYQLPAHLIGKRVQYIIIPEQSSLTTDVVEEE